MKRSIFEGILSLLLGVSWAFLIIGTYVTFNTFSTYSFYFAILASFIFLFIGLFLILLLEMMDLQMKKFKEMQKQTELLNQINENLPNNRPEVLSEL